MFKWLGLWLRRSGFRKFVCTPTALFGTFIGAVAYEEREAGTVCPVTISVLVFSLPIPRKKRVSFSLSCSSKVTLFHALTIAYIY